MILDQIIIPNKEKYYKESSTKENKSTEKPKRSVLKSISWRIIGTLDTIVISWLITGEVSLALTIGSIEVITKMILYFFHERIWNIIKWGKQ